MRNLVHCIIAIAATTAIATTTASADKREIDCGKTATFTINDGRGTYNFVGTCDKIMVTGGENTLIIEAVKELSITGAGNTIDVGAVDKILAVGTDNKIRYKKGLSAAKPTISSVGQHNTITRAK